MSSGRSQDVKNNENCTAVTSKSGRPRSLTRGSNYRTLTGKNSVF